jgi:hypothetical protein
MIDHNAFVHPKAHVEDASLGARTKVWQFASVIRAPPRRRLLDRQRRDRGRSVRSEIG